MKINSLLKKYFFLDDHNNEFIQNIDFSKTNFLNTSTVIKEKKFTNELQNKKLPDYIFKFYAYNEILASLKSKNNGIIEKENLNILKDYGNFINDFSKRIFSFILYSCLSEVKHSEVLKRNYIDIYQGNVTNHLKKSYVDKIITAFNKGKKYKLLNTILSDIKEKTSTNEYEDKIKDSAYITKLVETTIQEYTYKQFPIAFRRAVVQKYFKLKYFKLSNDYLDILYEDYQEKNQLPNMDTVNKFKNFMDFVLELKNTKLNGDSGDLQRKIVHSNLIKNSKVKDLTIEEMLDFLSIVFNKGFSYSRLFGGKAWSDIANHALSFSRGEINAEIFIDQALSLEHNSGKMFSKNFIFNKDENKKYFSYLFMQNNCLESESLSLNLTEFVLNIQSSSSVLSLSQYQYIDIENLTNNTVFNNIKKINPLIDSYYFSKLKKNLLTLKSFSNEFNSLDEMVEIAKKLNFEIPAFNFPEFLKISIEKDLLMNIENVKNIDLNQIQHNLVTKTYSKNIEPCFELHNLNSNKSKELTKELIGGKAFGLITLITKGFNVPKALVFDTKTCLSYLDNKDYFQKEYNVINQKISDYLISENKQPLLVSVRSGAPVSMPGMMDSILNVGIDDKSYPKLCKIYSKEVIDQCSISFMTQFCSSKLNINIDFSNNIYLALTKFCTVLKDKNILYESDNFFPLSKEKQIKLSVEAVFDSWNSPRAIAWRNEKNIDHNLGTAATVQQMVFGNKNDKSFTCVIFSRDCITGKPDIMGEYLPQAQGEDLVNGKRTPLPISELKISNPKIYQEIEYIAKNLEEDQKAIQDIEITVEDGKVYVLQMRNAVISPEAQLALAKDMNLNLLDVIQPKSLIGEAKVDTLLKSDYNGLAGSPGLISGIIVRNEEDIDKYKSHGKDLIFFSNQALPEHAPLMIATQGFITEFGGATSHAAILARSMGKPCIVGIGKQNEEVLESGSIITVDASEGKIWKGELPIIINQDKAIILANQLLKNNKIKVPEKIPNSKKILKIWTTTLPNYNVLEKPQNKHKMFLNIAQQTALALQLEHFKNNQQFKIKSQQQRI